MNDMSRPRSFPAAPDHEHHDQLLVARYAAGDALGEGERRDATALVTGCGACAALAADLRQLSRLVAWEPVPPRRRDFRLGPQQAERLGGNAASRFLRRLSLPRSRAFGPAAAGLLSVGLAFMVVGYAWPGGGTLDMGGESMMAPAVVEPSSASPVLLPQAPVAAGALDDVPAEANGLTPEEVLEGAQAPGLAQKSSAAQVESADRRALRAEADTFAGAAADEDASSDLAEPELGVASSDAVEAPVPEAQDVIDAVGGDESAVAAPMEDGSAIEAALIIVGLGLAIVGGLSLLLAWLTRRAGDPLLR